MLAANLREAFSQQEVARIASGNSAFDTVEYNGVIHTYKYDLYPTVTTLHVFRDFMAEKTDKIRATILIPAGDYYSYMAKETDHIQMSLTRKNSSGNNYTTTYKLFILSPIFKNPQMSTLTHDELNQQLVEIEVQLLDMFYYEYRNLFTSGVFQKQKLGNILPTLMTNVNSNDKHSFYITSTTNPRVYENIVITTGTRLLDLPAYLHNRYGLYNGEPNSYVLGLGKHHAIYVYPLISKTYTSDYELVILDGANILNTSASNRFIVEDNIVSILAVSVMSSDFKQKNSAIHGNAVVVTTDETHFNRSVSTSSSEVKVDKSNLTESLINEDMVDNTSQIRYKSGLNPHQARAEILAGRGNYYTVTCTHLDLNLFKPNLKVTIHTTEDNKVVKLLGTLHIVEMSHSNRSQGGWFTLKVFVTDRL